MLQVEIHEINKTIVTNNKHLYYILYITGEGESISCTTKIYIIKLTHKIEKETQTTQQQT